MHCTIEGTHLGEWRGIPPTGKHAIWTATAFRRVRDGKIVQGFDSWNWLSVVEQLGGTVTIEGAAMELHSAPAQRPRLAGTE